ncbi:MAG TPA: hypothetical protein VEQ58_20290, partial [Polyangiaceae bacterium]|nr:hypothetical protein [Polyangiaceae bacterium]
DTLAPSSFGVLGSNKSAGSLGEPRGPRAAMSTLGELDVATATATLRPPGAVPPPPRTLPTPPFEGHVAERGAPSPNKELGSSPRSPQPQPQPDPAPPKAATSSLDSTVDIDGSAAKKAAQAELLERTRLADAGSAKADAGSAKATGRASAVPPPGLFIADEPVERRPRQPTLVTVQRNVLTRMRAMMLVLGGLLLLAAGALIVMLFRRPDAAPSEAPTPSASAKPVAPTCALLAPPSRISPIERSVPISTRALPDGTVALAIADSKTTVAGFIYDPLRGEPQRTLAAPPGEGDVSHVTASEPLGVDRSSPDFAFAQAVTPAFALGVGPAGVLRRGTDGATGVVWPLSAGVRITPPRVASLANAHFVTFRQGGADGQIMSGWLRPDGSAAGEATALEGLPKTLGTPSASVLGQQAIVLFSARDDKSQPYRIFAATAAAGQSAGKARALDLPTEGGGALTPALSALGADRYLVQWTDGNVGQYQVHVRIFDAELAPLSAPLLVSAKGANAGQGTIVSTSQTTVSFFIQTTAGHDELWGVPLSCH